MNKPIGGYFELEINNFGTIYHDTAIAVNSGRNALEYILILNNYKKIFIPYYTCDVTLQPLKKLNIDFEFYYLDNDYHPLIESINKDEALLYVNYFGVMNSIVYNLSTKFKNLIIDNAQAFFAKPLIGVSTIYSPRKFFGLPDGGFVYTNNKNKLKLESDKSSNRISHLIIRIEDGAEAGYNLFKKNDANLDFLPLKRMSNLTMKLLLNIDYKKIRKKRNENFKNLHDILGQNNEFTRFIEEEIDGPMVYPYLKKGNSLLREKLIENKVFVAKYWPNVEEWIPKKESLELYLHNNLIPLPIDQRYNKKDMERIVNIIKS